MTPCLRTLTGTVALLTCAAGAVDGKPTVRAQPVRQFVVRGSASSGFRAPSLGQSFFSSTATNVLNVRGQELVPFESLDAARKLGGRAARWRARRACPTAVAPRVRCRPGASARRR